MRKKPDFPRPNKLKILLSFSVATQKFEIIKKHSIRHMKIDASELANRTLLCNEFFYNLNCKTCNNFIMDRFFYHPTSHSQKPIIRHGHSTNDCQCPRGFSVPNNNTKQTQQTQHSVGRSFRYSNSCILSCAQQFHQGHCCTAYIFTIHSTHTHRYSIHLYTINGQV